MTGTVLVARLDAAGGVLLAGPAVRAVAAGAARVVLLVGPRGRQAADLLPSVDETLVWPAPWIEPSPQPLTAGYVARLVDSVRRAAVDEAVILTSYHQSALPLALLLRLAGVVRITAISDDYPGSLLDVRHADPGNIPEAVRALSVAAAAGFPRPVGDDGRLAVLRPLPDPSQLTGGPDAGPYVILHPGTSVPARSWPLARWTETAALLRERGRRVVVTGSREQRELTAQVASGSGLDLGGRTTFAELAGVLDGAAAVAVANTGPAHLAAAVGTPVVSLFAPTVPAARWVPYGVPVIVLGDQGAPCRDTRANLCPVPGHPCLSGVTAAEVADAVDRLAGVSP